jgi:hypothetical protein
VSGVEAIRGGFARLWRRGAFAVVATWAIVTILAVVAVAPAWAWWRTALGHTIDGVRLLGSPNVATLVEMLRESPFAARTIVAAAIAAAVLALLLNPFLAGGVIGALVRQPPVGELGLDARGRGTRFAADGVWLYGPLLRVALIVWPAAAIAIACGAAAVAIVLVATPVPVLGLAAGVAVIACGMLAATVIVDLARIHVARTGVRRARAGVLAALRIVGSQLPRLLPVGLAFGTALALGGAVLLAVRGWLSGETWPSILAGVAVQQAHGFARTWLRAGLVASEVVLAEADAEARAAVAASAVEAAAASVAALEERPETLEVVQGEGDGRPRDADAEEAGPAQPALVGDRRGGEHPPVA